MELVETCHKWAKNHHISRRDVTLRKPEGKTDSSDLVTLPKKNDRKIERKRGEGTKRAVN
jgi:hypothetical protein